MCHMTWCTRAAWSLVVAGGKGSAFGRHTVCQ